MEIVYDESTGKWGEYEEPYTTLDVQTEEDWNKLEFMINNFSKLEEENKELKKYINQLDEEQKSIDEFATAVHEEYKREIAELKRLLKLAVEDIQTLLCSVGAPIYSREGRESCKVCCFNHKCGCSNYCSVRTAYKKWKHAEEALEVLGDEK